MEPQHELPRMNRPVTIQFIGSLLALSLLGGCEPNSGEQEAVNKTLLIEQAYIRKPIANSTTATGYFKLTNRSENTLTLLAVESTLARAVEIHEHRHDNGTMRMRRLDSVSIEAKGSLEFQPGAKHLMLFGFDASTAKEDQLTFKFDDGQRVSAPAAIKSLL